MVDEPREEAAHVAVAKRVACRKAQTRQPAAVGEGAASSGAVMVGGCRLHSRRGLTVVLSSGATISGG